MSDPPNRADRHNHNFNCILDGRIRVTPISAWHWDEKLGVWSVFAHKWNKFNKTWSAPMLMHCREFESELNKMSAI